MVEYNLKEWGVWEDLLPRIINSAEPEKQKFQDANTIEQIVKTKDDLKDAIDNKLLRPEILLVRSEELYQDDMRGRVRRLIDVLDIWETPNE